MASQQGSQRTLRTWYSSTATTVLQRNEGYTLSTTCIQPALPKKLGYYVYSSKPKHLQIRPKHYRSGAHKPKHSSDFYNLMWDPHVYRGQTFKTFQEAERERERLAKAEKDKLNRKSRKPPGRILGGIEIPKTPPLNDRRGRVDTRRFLEEVSEPAEKADGTTQTDIIEPKPPLPVYVVPKLGFDISTEMAIEDLYDFDEEVEQVVETLADKVVEQSLLEVMEEEELLDLRTRQNEFEEKRRIRLLDQHLLILREQYFFDEQEPLLDKLVKDSQVEKDLEEHVKCQQFSHSYLLLMVPKLLEALTSEGFVTEEHLGEITEAFKPWLNAEVTSEIEKKLMSRALVDEILNDVVEKRESEYAEGRAMELARVLLENYFLLQPEDE